jgi:hypothetical protein
MHRLILDPVARWYGSDNDHPVSSSRLLEFSSRFELVTDSRPTAMATLRLPIDQVIPPTTERRLRAADDDQLAALATSLRDHGQLEAVGVRSRADGRFDLIFGQRRLEAARRAGFRDISATVFNATDEQVLQLALVENMHRRSLSSAERVRGLRMLAALHQPGTQPGGRGRGAGQLEPPAEQPFSFNGLARKLSVTQPTVARWVKLANDATLMAAVESGELPLTTASFIASAPAEVRGSLVEQVKRGDLSPGQVRDRVRAMVRVQRFRGTGPARFGDADATSRILRRVLAELELVVAISTEAERDLLEQIADRVQELRTGNALD